MRWSIQGTLLSVVLPLGAVSLFMLVNTSVDLFTTRGDIAAFRASALRAVYAERFARQLQGLLEDSREVMQGTAGASEHFKTSHASISDTATRLQELVEAPAGDDQTYRFTAEILDAWVDAPEQVDHYLERSARMVASGKRAEARRVMEDDLEALIRTRLRTRIDTVVEREHSRIERYTARLARGAEHGLLQIWAVATLPEELRVLAYDAMLTERFGRFAIEEFRNHAHAFSRPMVESANDLERDDTRSEGADHVLTQLGQLERWSAFDDPTHLSTKVEELRRLYSGLRAEYREVRTLSAAAGPQEVAAAVAVMTTYFAETFRPRLQALAAEDQQILDQEMQRLDLLADKIVKSAGTLASLLLLLVIASPVLISRLLVKPLAELAVVGRKFREGDSDVRPAAKLRGEMGELGRLVSYLMGELQRSNRKVHELAFYDAVTGLSNRELFQERLGTSLVNAGLEGRGMSLLEIGFDELKQVNQTLGETAGDDLLRQAAERLRGCFDPPEGAPLFSPTESAALLARVGGGRFAILLAQPTDAHSLSTIADRIIAALTAPCVVLDREISSSISLGIAIYPGDGDDSEKLLQSAATACQHARTRGRSIYQFYSKLMNTKALRKLHIRSRLSGALERGDLTVYYQPIRDAREGHLAAAEALLRWTDSEMGPVATSEFIGIAEETELIMPIGSWVLKEACSQARCWQDAGFREIRMAVNVSPKQLRESSWAETVEATLRSTRLSPAHLDLEITETAIMRDDPVIDANLARLRELGVGISLDDFGMGYSSLSLLRRFPITRIKIDRCFVSEIEEIGEGKALAGAILAMSQSLGLRVIAEGIETPEQVNFLRERGCDELQGYLISRAVAPEDFEKFLDPEKDDAAAGGSLNEIPGDR